MQNTQLFQTLEKYGLPASMYILPTPHHSTEPSQKFKEATVKKSKTFSCDVLEMRWAASYI